MSAQAPTTRITTVDIRNRKGAAPIVSLTAYHAHTAAIADKHVDFLLVGDSLGMVMHGYETTVPVSLELMIMHGMAVVRGAKRALVVVDMPFGAYEESPQVAFRNAARVMKETGCGAVKIEGGRRMAETIHYLVERGIPVMAHIGLTPQSVHALGGYRVQGRDEETARRLRSDAKALADAGAFAIVLELVKPDLASDITGEVDVPTIGIGSGPGCSGQVQVLHDMLGMFPDVHLRHAKRYAEIGTAIRDAVNAYAKEVRAGAFP